METENTVDLFNIIDTIMQLAPVFSINVPFFSIRTVLSNSELVNTGIGLQGIGEQDRIWARVSKVG